MTTSADLERASELADAQLGVAEELGWPIALLAGTLAYTSWSSWLAAGGIGAAAYALAVFRYRRRSDRAEDAYYRAAGLGKYAKSGSGTPPEQRND
jgi:hypothetical protein